MAHGLAHPPSRKSITSSGHCQIRPAVPVLIVVEGVHDVEFLRRLTSKLHPQHKSIPDLVRLEREARAIFIPFGGGHVLPWAQRFAPLQCLEFHLYDREIEPETAIRRQAVDVINARAGCRALLLPQRSLESYLHPAAIFDAGGGQYTAREDEDIATAVARAWYSRPSPERDWDQLPCRSRRRRAAHVKRWLNSEAVPHMTLGLLLQTDPTGEFLAWIRAIGTATADF